MTSRVANSLNKLGAELRGQHPGIVLGFGRNDSDSDHDFYSVRDSRGVGVVRAVDIMGAGRDYDRLAANLAAKLNKHPAMGHGAYVIHKQRIISADRIGEGWRAMEDRGSPTANHFDHVHVSVTTNQAGYDSKSSWGALFTGSGTGAAPMPAGPAPATTPAGETVPVSATAAHHGTSSAATDAQPAADTDSGSGGVLGLVAMGAGLGLGVVLIALGTARLVKPTTDAITSDVQSVATTVATRGAVR